ncbi:MAG: energy transducer TonB [Bacteroidetes bacterium]|nr:energy transducer TonB [Bacteroidota bacterium]
MKTILFLLAIVIPLTMPIRAQQEEATIDESQYLETIDYAPAIVGGLEALHKVIVYPDSALKSGVEGMVIVKVLLAENGRADKVSIQKSDSPLLSAAALDAVRKVRFLPAKMGDVAVKCKLMVPVKFRLH